jgi:hypothetical protein
VVWSDQPQQQSSTTSHNITNMLPAQQLLAGTPAQIVNQTTELVVPVLGFSSLPPASPVSLLQHNSTTHCGSSSSSSNQQWWQLT